MKRNKSILSKAKKVAGEVSDATVGAVKAVVRMAKKKLPLASTAKPRKRPATAKAATARSKATSRKPAKAKRTTKAR